MNLFQKQRERYKERKKTYGLSPEGVGWKNRKAQEIRFEQLTKVIDSPAHFSLNDLGCGLGHLQEYLHNKGFRKFLYKGYDLFQEMVDGAKKRFAEQQEIKFQIISHVSEIDVADFSLASGIFSFKGQAAETAWLSYILEILEEMNKKSMRGFSFNMLTKYSDPEYMENELYYADPCFMFDFCKRNFSRDVALLHDYQEYDFTILVRKAG